MSQSILLLLLNLSHYFDLLLLDLLHLFIVSVAHEALKIIRLLGRAVQYIKLLRVERRLWSY